MLKPLDAIAQTREASLQSCLACTDKIIRCKQTQLATFKATQMFSLSLHLFLTALHHRLRAPCSWHSTAAKCQQRLLSLPYSYKSRPLKWNGPPHPSLTVYYHHRHAITLTCLLLTFGFDVLFLWFLQNIARKFSPYSYQLSH